MSTIAVELVKIVDIEIDDIGNKGNKKINKNIKKK